MGQWQEWQVSIIELLNVCVHKSGEIVRTQKYVIDLQAYMAECEANYWRLQKLMPDDLDEIAYAVQLPDGTAVTMKLAIVQRCKYTTMLTVDQGGLQNWLAHTHFEVRIYHDARMAEVISCQRQGKVHPVYPYPNEKMHQKDEKFQQHRFFSECLANCLKNGFSETQIPVL